MSYISYIWKQSLPDLITEYVGLGCYLGSSVFTMCFNVKTWFQNPDFTKLYLFVCFLPCFRMDLRTH